MSEPRSITPELLEAAWKNMQEYGEYVCPHMVSSEAKRRGGYAMCAHCLEVIWIPEAPR